jgi:MFS superfamily sulfate permease-like transporter
MSPACAGWPGWWARGFDGYGSADLGHDIGAGLMLTALLVPAGMGYAAAALPPETGLCRV